MNTSYRYISAILFVVLITLTSCEDENDEKQPVKEEAIITHPDAPEKIPVSLVNMFPHNTSAYTEGLEYIDGVMYESTGQYGRSYLYKYEPFTGKIIKEVKIDNQYFGEGMTVLADKIYMLTYRAKTGLIFEKSTLKQIGEFDYPNAEGWGMTNDGTHLIYSEGTPYLYFIEPGTFVQTKRIEVRDNFGAVSNINELEYINGYIYANQYETDYILKIDPNTGKIVGQADLRAVRAQAGILPTSHIEGQPEVMNGIAYDKQNNRIFVTGKNWPKLLEVRLDN